MTQSTTREARTQLILIVIAIAVGGVVFAFTGDFVIGVGVGAAALRRRTPGNEGLGHTLDWIPEIC